MFGTIWSANRRCASCSSCHGHDAQRLGHRSQKRRLLARAVGAVSRGQSCLSVHATRLVASVLTEDRRNWQVRRHGVAAIQKGWSWRSWTHTRTEQAGAWQTLRTWRRISSAGTTCASTSSSSVLQSTRSQRRSSLRGETADPAVQCNGTPS